MLRFSDQLSYIPGLVRGLQQPAIAGGIELKEFAAIDCDALLSEGRSLVNGFEPSKSTVKDEEDLIQCLFNLLICLFHSQQIISSKNFVVKARSSSQTDSKEFEFCFPMSVSADASRHCFTWLAKLVELHSSASSNNSHSKESLAIDLAELNNKLSSFSAPSYNRFAIAIAAFELDIPLFPLHIDLYYLGHGNHCRMMASSFTEDTPAISANLAKNKFYTGELLRTIGLPAPKQYVVNDKEQAQTAANKLGFPVVVKAADLEEGKGVYPNLNSVDEVARAFEATRELSNRTLVEEHIEGQTHRFTVFQNHILRIVKRIPGGVTGSGIHTVAELVKIAQQTRRHQYLSKRQGKPVLDLDQEAQSFLDAQGLSADSIPEKDRFVRLRSRDNASSGGSTEHLQETEVHPDNLALATETAKALRLDFAGIDLIIADVTKSWMAQKAAVCEVNAQPTLGATDSPHLYQDVLKQLIPDGGRIPIHLVILPTDADPDLAKLQSLQSQLHCNGLSCKAGVFINDKQFAPAFENSHSAAKSVLLNSDVESALCVYHASEIVLYGLLSNRFESVQVVGTDSSAAANNSKLQGAISLLPPGCSPDFVE